MACKILDLFQPEFFQVRVIAGTFVSIIRTEILIRSIAIVFAVCKIMFMVVRNQIVQSKSVMATDEINTLISASFADVDISQRCRRSAMRLFRPSPDLLEQTV